MQSTPPKPVNFECATSISPPFPEGFSFRKPRRLPKLLSLLSAVHVEELINRLVNGHTYKQAQHWLQYKCGVKASNGTLCRFWQQFCVNRLIAKQAPPVKPDVRRVVFVVDFLPEGALSVRSFEAPVNGGPR